MAGLRRLLELPADLDIIQVREVSVKQDYIRLGRGSFAQTFGPVPGGDDLEIGLGEIDLQDVCQFRIAINIQYPAQLQRRYSRINSSHFLCQ